MSHVDGVDDYRRATSPPHNLKRKRRSPSPTASTPRSHISNGLPRSTNNPQLSRASATADDSRSKSYLSPDSDVIQQTDHSDLLRVTGSTSSLSSAASSVFSHNALSHTYNSRTISLAHSVTPLTVHSESSPQKRSSPTSTFVGIESANMDTNGDYRIPPPPGEPAAREPRPQMLPPPGKAKGYRVVWDPELESKLSREERKRATLKRREFGTETYLPDPPPDPRLAIPGYMSGHCRGKNVPSKAITRIAPYTIPPYKIDRYSVGPGEATQVVAYGFDPFLPEATLRLNFSTFGSIAFVQNKTDPDTGSFLGIALIKFRDAIRDGEHIAATEAAKRAEAELNGARIGVHIVRVEVDREGRRFKRQVESALKRAREERAKNEPRHEAPPPPPAASIETPLTHPADPLANAPKGPSGKGAKAAEAPRASAAPAGPAAPPNPKSAAAALVEEEPVLSKIKRKPYIFIAASAVPVLGTTIPHLKKRLKSYDWREVRLDQTGYYVVFEDSKRGEDETERCFNECNKAALFTYFMVMECQKYGNPDYERSPSPERVLAAKQQRENFERLAREEKEDLEIEKKRRAENLDPVQGALDQLRIELKDKIMSDIKTRIAIPVFHDSLDPAKHVAKRRKLGLPDPMDKENNGPTLLFNKAGDSPSQTPRGRHGHPLSHSKPLRPHDPNQQRGRKNDRDRGRGQENVFLDERRRRPAPRRENIRGLHFRLQQLFDDEEDSDDERRTSLTRDTEDQESRPLSRSSRTSTPFESESAETPKSKRRKTAEWAEDERESFDALQKQLLGHLLHKEPEDLATRELELVVNTLPRSSKYAARARTELFLRMRSRDDDDLFQVGGNTKRDFDTFMSDIKLEDDAAIPSTEVKAIKEKVKKKRKTKKQILEEQEELKAKTQKAKSTSKPVDEETIAKIEEKEAELAAAEELEREDIAWSFTHDKPRRVIEDERPVVLDIDGWQEVIKDDEDLAFARLALAEEEPAELGDAKLWAWKQKEIKALNTGARGPVEAAAGIEGYYVPNSTGCARTEGTHKILNEEKSKYLPHRIKVQKAREERQAQAKANPAAAAEAAKAAAAEKFVSTATSRSNRVNNRRLVNDINLQKQALATVNSDADIAIRFNQLKKRKKLVKFDRSAIHGWGLYAEENIAINDLIIEYVGEKVRQKVADMRELKYDRQGVGSSYLFRMIDDEIIDATKKGGIARFINHSCNPNCTAKIIKVEGTPRIVIYALKDIVKNDELTYDYKFEREYGATDRIPCLCGSANCKGFLN